MLTVRRETLDIKQDPNFQYGETQALVAVMVLVISFIVTVGCLVMQQRYERQYSQYNSVPSHAGHGHMHGSVGSDDEYGRPILTIDDSRSSGLQSHSSESTPRLRAYSRSFGGAPPTHPPQICGPYPVPPHHRGSSFLDSHISITEDGGLEAAGPSGLCAATNKQKILNDMEDLKNSEYGDGDGDDESLFSYNDDLCAPGKQNCSLEQRKNCAVLLEKYRNNRSQLTEPEEIGIVRDRDDEFQMLRHIILLLLLCGSMFVVRKINHEKHFITVT